MVGIWQLLQPIFRDCVVAVKDGDGGAGCVGVFILSPKSPCANFGVCCWNDKFGAGDDMLGLAGFFAGNADEALAGKGARVVGSSGAEK